MKQNILIAALLAGMLALAGCGGGSSSNNQQVNNMVDCDDGSKAATAAGCPMPTPMVDLPAGNNLDGGPDKHSGEYNVDAGKTRDVGNVRFSCTGSTDCTFTIGDQRTSPVVTVAAGTVTATTVPVPGSQTVPGSTGSISGSNEVTIVNAAVDGSGNWTFTIKDGGAEKEKIAITDNIANAEADNPAWLNSNNELTPPEAILYSLAAYAKTKADGADTIVDNDNLMLLGAWAVYPAGTSPKPGKLAHATALTDAGKRYLDRRLGVKGTTAATYNGEAVGITVKAMNGTGTAETPFKADYEAWTGGAVRLMADFEKMELKGWVKKNGILNSDNGNAEITLKKASIASYAASGDIDKPAGPSGPAADAGDWSATFSHNGQWIAGKFDYLPNSKLDSNYMRHYGAFGACNPACNQ